MNWADLPSLNSLKAFSALAESGSYTKAGAALNVSHAAVSQQVKALEARLGATLVARTGRGITLTEEGAALATITDDVNEVRGQYTDRKVDEICDQSGP